MCRNVKENKYLCNRQHIKRKSNRRWMPFEVERTTDEIESRKRLLAIGDDSDG